jgi:DNA-binding response OmpR family regulator
MTKIIVADDSSAIQKVIRIAFAAMKAQIAECHSLTQCMNILERNGSADLLILDAGLPGLRGEQELAALVKKIPADRIILLAGSYDTFDETLYGKLGLDAILKKPFDAASIVSLAQSRLPTNLEGKAVEISVTELPNSSENDATKALIDLGRKGRKAFDEDACRAVIQDKSPDMEISAPSMPSSKSIKLADLDLAKRDFIIEPDPPKGASHAREGGQTQIRLPPIQFAQEQTSQPPPWTGLEERMEDLASEYLSKHLKIALAKEIKEYCQSRFPEIAREVISEEIQRLTRQRRELLEDH